ncbi:MAG: hypothetical protein U1E97_05700 [Alphaproteobacteria bacterium]
MRRAAVPEICIVQCPGTKRHSVTVSLTVNFHRAIRHGRLIVTGRRLDGSQRIFGSTIEVGTIDGPSGHTGLGGYRYLRGGKTAQGVSLVACSAWIT